MNDNPSVHELADQHYSEEQRKSTLILPDGVSPDTDPHYHGQFAYRTPTPAPLTTPTNPNTPPDTTPTITMNGEIMYAARVVNANLSRNMVEMIDKHNNKYRISAVEILKMAQSHHFTVTGKDIKGTKYYYLINPIHHT